MKTTLLLISGICAAAISATSGATPPASIVLAGLDDNVPLALVWHDEFDGAAIDETKWDVPSRARQGASFWHPSNVSLTNGVARFDIHRMSRDEYTFRYQSACLRSRKDHDPKQTRFEFTYGYTEVRCRLPRHVRADYWAAFWLMGGDVLANAPDSRDGMEVDIFETFSLWNNATLNHALHWGGYGKTHNMANFKSENMTALLDGEFHTFGLYWDENEYVFYVDGRVTARTPATGLGRVVDGKPLSSGTCRKPAYIKLSVEAAPWAGPNGGWESNLPEHDVFEVDYVRVYQKPGAKTK